MACESKPVCIKSQIEKAESTLRHISKIISEIERIPVWKRDSSQNENLLKNRHIHDLMREALQWMYFDETNTDHFHIDVPEPTEIVNNEKPKADEAYLI